MEAVVDMADGVDALVEGHPIVAGARCGRKAPVRVVSRIDRVLREGMQDIGEHQFLMLLLMVEPNLNQRRDLAKLVLAGLAEEFDDGRIDMATVGADLAGAGARDVAAMIAGVTRAGADVIGIEQEGEVGVERPIARRVLTEQKLLPEPGGMGPVPLRRTRIRHGLDLLVLGRQRRSPAFGLAADGEKGSLQPLSESIRGGRR
jgi:hypothetical protein